MKRLLCIALFLSLLTGCDPSCSYEVQITNQIESDIVVITRSNNQQVTIKPGYSETLEGDGSFCNDYADHTGVLYNAIMTIDGIQISDEIWLRKYWNYIRNKDHITHSLIVTDELLQSLETNLNI